jgi:hypothetical protein
MTHVGHWHLGWRGWKQKIDCTTQKSVQSAVLLKREILWDSKQKKKRCVEEGENRVMPQKIRSDRLIVNGREKTVLKRKGT